MACLGGVEVPLRALYGKFAKGPPLELALALAVAACLPAAAMTAAAEAEYMLALEGGGLPAGAPGKRGGRELPLGGPARSTGTCVAITREQHM